MIPGAWGKEILNDLPSFKHETRRKRTLFSGDSDPSLERFEISEHTFFPYQTGSRICGRNGRNLHQSNIEIEHQRDL